MRAGRLDREVSILRKSVSLSGSGVALEDWSPVRVDGSISVWASMRPIKGEERIVTDQIKATEQIEFRVRWCPELASLTPLDQLIEPPAIDGSPFVLPALRSTYQVIEVSEIARREGLLIMAYRVVDDLVLTEEEAP